MKKRWVHCLLVLAFVIGLGGFGMSGRYEVEEQITEWRPTSLKVQLLEEPYGIDTGKINFSWYMNSDKQEIYQAGYHIVIASSLQDMDEEKYLLDTGWKNGKQNSAVKVEGIEDILEDNSLYYWKIELMDSEGEQSSFSDVQSFSTSVGNQWVSTNGIWEREKTQYAFLRTEFSIEDVSRIEKAIMSVTATSPEETKQYVYNLYLNENYVGSGPARASGEQINYNTYDVTEYLKENNVLGSICYTNKEQAFLCQMTIFYLDGTKEIIINSGRDKEKWKTLDGDNAYGNNGSVISTPYYVAAAENINASFFPDGWLSEGFDDSTWETPIVSREVDAGSLTAYSSENLKHYYAMPQKVYYYGGGHYRVDFGKEIIGGISISAFNIWSKPVEILIRYGEELEEEGTVKYRMRTGNVYEETWTLESGEQNYENIGMKTFRYVDIYCGRMISLHDGIKGVEIRQEFNNDKSDFASSNRLLNEIYDMTKYTIQTTNQDLYVDSQSRERGVYEGDALINMLASYTFSDHYTLARYSNEYLYENRTWPQEYPMYAVMCAWWDYMYTGDKESLVRNYEVLKEKVDSIIIDEECGLVKSDYGEDGFNRPLVDWPMTERDDYAYDEAKYNTVVNAVSSGALMLMAEIAEVVGETEDAQFYHVQSEAIKQAMIDHLYIKDQGFCDGLTVERQQILHYAQHATAYALFFSIYDSGEMKNDLIRILEEDQQIEGSVFYAYFLLQGLYNADAGDYATSLMLDKSPENSHTWAYMLREEGATISAEAWSKEIKENMTYSHPWGAGPASLIVSGMFGIKPLVAGFDEFEIKLQPGSVEYASIRVPTMKGEIGVEYCLNRDGCVDEVVINIPSNSKAQLKVPTNRSGNWIVDGKQYELLEAEGYIMIMLGSGTHTIERLE